MIYCAGNCCNAGVSGRRWLSSVLSLDSLNREGAAPWHSVMRLLYERSMGAATCCPVYGKNK